MTPSTSINTHRSTVPAHLLQEVDIDFDTFDPASPPSARFEAGRGSERKDTHGSIEAVLREAGFIEREVHAIYFGNWLRDYSQLLDPKIVRASNMPKSFPDLLSRHALTQIVDVLAVREFTDLMAHYRERFRVTPERLGVYRPSEHIDNPKTVNPGSFDPTDRDADFEPWVLADDVVVGVDPESSMKRYLQRSANFMESELGTAVLAGRASTDGLRALGSALHVLEDFFAHSNFVELSLIKMGHKDVLPWTSRTDCKHGLPLVTGSFGSTDAIASLAAPLGKILFSTKETNFAPIKPGVRTERDEIILILLREHPDKDYLKAYDVFLNARDSWADLPYSEYVQAVNHYLAWPGRAAGNAFASVMQGLFTILGNSIGNAQTRFDDDPNTSGSTDPSHSQLAKDHAEHPLHGLAARLAREAVLNIGRQILEQWRSPAANIDVAKLATDYFKHPMDSSWQDDTVKKWAEGNPQSVQMAASKTTLDNVALEQANRSIDQLEKFHKEGGSFLENFLTEKNPLLQLWKQTPIGSFLGGKR
ncbi:MAG: HET-C-related protein [Pseudomonas caspiana]